MVHVPARQEDPQMTALMRAIDRLNDAVGRFMAWMMLPLVIIAFTVVVLRYVLSIGFTWMQESYVWIHSTIFMLAAGYNLVHDFHVRVDVVRRRMSGRNRALVDLCGALFFVTPMVVAIFIASFPPILFAWRIGEGSPAPGGLPGVYLHKTVILVFCFLLALQGLSLALRSYMVLRGRLAPAAD